MIVYRKNSPIGTKASALFFLSCETEDAFVCKRKIKEFVRAGRAGLSRKENVWTANSIASSVPVLLEIASR